MYTLKYDLSVVQHSIFLVSNILGTGLSITKYRLFYKLKMLNTNHNHNMNNPTRSTPISLLNIVLSSVINVIDMVGGIEHHTVLYYVLQLITFETKNPLTNNYIYVKERIRYFM